MKLEYWSPLLLLYCCLVLPLGQLIFALCIKCSYVACMNIYKYDIFLINWPFYHYIMIFVVCCSSHWLKVYFILYKYIYSNFLLASFCMDIFFHYFTCSLCVSLCLKRVSCRQNIGVFFCFFKKINLATLALFFFFKIYLFIDWLIAMLGLRFCARAFCSCGKRGPLFIAVRGPLTIVASLVAEHRLQTRRLSSCGSRA